MLTYLGAYSQALISGDLYLGAYNPGLYAGAYIRGLISGVLIAGDFIWGLISGVLISGEIYRGLIYSSLYPGNLYLGAYTRADIRGTYIWEIISGGLISDGLYQRTNIRGLIAGAYISAHRFFKTIFDKAPVKRLYVPELEKKTVVISIRRPALLKGRSSGAILRLREAINSPKWYHAWVKLVPESFGGPQNSHGRLNKGI